MNTDWIERSRLWLVLDRAAAQPRHSLAAVASMCIAGGVDVVVFRMKDADASEAIGHATKVRHVCEEAGVPFVLSHFLELVDELHPAAFHAGKADAPLPEIRYRLPHEVALGYSAHAVTEAQTAIDAGADYLFLGPIFATPSKELFGAPLGLEAVKQGAALPKPVVFIGGMDATTIPQAVEAGARRVAAISALQSVPDEYGPAHAARELRALLPAARAASRSARHKRKAG